MDLLKRAKAAYSDRQIWESLWDITYRYLAPERAVFFRDNEQSPHDIGQEVFDSTAIDDAERLANLVVARLTPPWGRWLRLTPKDSLANTQKEQVQGELRYVEDRLFELLPKTGFYEELQPLLLDRIVGGTGAWAAYNTDQGLQWCCTPLARMALEQDYTGRLSLVSHKFKWSLHDVDKRFGKDKVPQQLREQQEGEKAGKRDLVIFHVCHRQADGQWENSYYLDHGPGVELERATRKMPDLYATRWARIPGTPYGRGPGFRALSDVRAINKLKELTLKNAAKAVAGVYTAWHDGVLNPHTIGFEPGTVIPVASNNIQDPPLAELPNTARFDISEWSMGELSSAIKRTFMADQFGPLQRTPRSAAEVNERTMQLAQDLGSSLSTFQREIVIPAVRRTLAHLQAKGEIDMSLAELDEVADLKIVSHLAQGQQQEEAQTILEFASVVAQFGEIDPKAGLVFDTQAGLRRVGRLQGVHPDDMRTPDEIQEISDQAAQTEAQMGAMEQGGQPPGGMQ